MCKCFACLTFAIPVIIIRIPSPPPLLSYNMFTIGGDDNCLDCTPDELAALVREIRDSSGLIGSHTYRLVSYKNTFVGRQLVDWLIAKKGYKSNYFDNTTMINGNFDKFSFSVCVCVQVEYYSEANRCHVNKSYYKNYSNVILFHFHHQVERLPLNWVRISTMDISSIM